MQSHCHRTPPARHQESHEHVRQAARYQQRQAMPGHGEKLRTGLRPRGLLQLECRSSPHHPGGGGELRKSYKATGGTEQEKADGG